MSKSNVGTSRWVRSAVAQLLFGAIVATGSVRGDSTEEEFFTQSVLPILEKYCFKCHSHASNTAKGGLVLDSRSGWMTGGETGPAIVARMPEQSLLIQAVRYSNADLQMPPTGKL